MKNTKKEFLDKFLEKFSFKMFLEEKQKGFCTVCNEPATPTLKVSVEIKREEFSRVYFTEYCNFCFSKGIGNEPLPQMATEISPMYA